MQVTTFTGELKNTFAGLDELAVYVIRSLPKLNLLGLYQKYIVLLVILLSHPCKCWRPDFLVNESNDKKTRKSPLFSHVCLPNNIVHLVCFGSHLMMEKS